MKTNEIRYQRLFFYTLIIEFRKSDDDFFTRKEFFELNKFISSLLISKSDDEFDFLVIQSFQRSTFLKKFLSKIFDNTPNLFSSPYDYFNVEILNQLSDPDEESKFKIAKNSIIYKILKSTIDDFMSISFEELHNTSENYHLYIKRLSGTNLPQNRIKISSDIEDLVELRMKNYFKHKEAFEKRLNNPNSYIYMEESLNNVLINSALSAKVFGQTFEARIAKNLVLDKVVSQGNQEYVDKVKDLNIILSPNEKIKYLYETINNTASHIQFRRSIRDLIGSGEDPVKVFTQFFTSNAMRKYPNLTFILADLAEIFNNYGYQEICLSIQKTIIFDNIKYPRLETDAVLADCLTSWVRCSSSLYKSSRIFDILETLDERVFSHNCENKESIQLTELELELNYYLSSGGNSSRIRQLIESIKILDPWLGQLKECEFNLYLNDNLREAFVLATSIEKAVEFHLRNFKGTDYSEENLKKPPKGDKIELIKYLVKTCFILCKISILSEESINARNFAKRGLELSEKYHLAQERCMLQVILWQLHDPIINRTTFRDSCEFLQISNQINALDGKFVWLQSHLKEVDPTEIPLYMELFEELILRYSEKYQRRRVYLILKSIAEMFENSERRKTEENLLYKYQKIYSQFVHDARNDFFPLHSEL